MADKVNDKKKRVPKERKRVSFWNEHERSRWLRIYDSRVNDGKTPTQAFDFANEDMEIRRLVMPYDPDLAMGRLQALELAEQLLDEMIAQRRRAVGETGSSNFGDEQLDELRAKVRLSRQPGDSEF